MALAEATHDAAPRRQKPASAITVNDAPRGQKNAGAEYFELRLDEEVAPARGMRPAHLAEQRGAQDRVLRHIVEQIVDFAPVVQIVGAPMPQTGDQLVDAFKHIDISVLEQVIEVPKIPRPLRAALAATQMAEQLVEVPVLEYVKPSSLEHSVSIHRVRCVFWVVCVVCALVAIQATVWCWCCSYFIGCVLGWLAMASRL